MVSLVDFFFEKLINKLLERGG